MAVAQPAVSARRRPPAQRRRPPARRPRSPGTIVVVLRLLHQVVPVARRSRARLTKVLRIKDHARVSTNVRVSSVVPARWVDVPVSPQDPVPDLSRLRPALSLLPTLP